MSRSRRCCACLRVDCVPPALGQRAQEGDDQTGDDHVTDIAVRLASLRALRCCKSSEPVFDGPSEDRGSHPHPNDQPCLEVGQARCFDLFGVVYRSFLDGVDKLGVVLIDGRRKALCQLSDSARIRGSWTDRGEGRQHLRKVDDRGAQRRTD
jgi:hypothetical protein